MPSRETVDAYVAAVVRNDHVQALRDFYHADAETHENAEAPTIGLAALVAKEEAALARVKSVHTHPPLALAIDGDLVVVHWVFDMTDQSGVVRRLDELALQRWRGERIASERFFYDTARAWAPAPDAAVDTTQVGPQT